MAFGQLTTKWRRLRTTLNFHSTKNAKIIRVSAKLLNYVIHKANEIGDDYDTVGLFDGDVVDPQQYGIEPLQGGGPNDNSDFNVNSEDYIIVDTEPLETGSICGLERPPLLHSTHCIGESSRHNDVVPRASFDWIDAIDVSFPAAG
jgi:hypothetical protein